MISMRSQSLLAAAVVYAVVSASMTAVLLRQPLPTAEFSGLGLPVEVGRHLTLGLGSGCITPWPNSAITLVVGPGDGRVSP